MKKVMLVLIGLVVVIFASCEKKEAISKEKQTLLAFGAILTIENGIDFDSLSLNGFSKQSVQSILKDDWSITDNKTAIKTLEWLKEEGHRTESNEILALIRNGEISKYKDLDSLKVLYDKCVIMLTEQFGISKETIEKVNTGAWDFDRIVNVARWCYFSGYITEDVAWSYIETAKNLSKEKLTSWEEFYASNVIGRSIGYEGDPEELEDAGNKLLKNNDSIWKKVSF